MNKIPCRRRPSFYSMWLNGTGLNGTTWFSWICRYALTSFSSPIPPGCSLESAFDAAQGSQKPLFLSKIETHVSFPYLWGKGLIQKKIPYSYHSFLNSFTKKQLGNLGNKLFSPWNVEIWVRGRNSIWGSPVSFVQVTNNSLRFSWPLWRLYCDFRKDKQSSANL